VGACAVPRDGGRESTVFREEYLAGVADPLGSQPPRLTLAPTGVTRLDLVQAYHRSNR
jgi:hypothetical protein